MAKKTTQTIGASIELVPKQIIASDDFETMFPQGCRVYLPDVGSDDFDTLLQAAVRVTDAGYIAVPHLPARRLTGEEEAEYRVQRFAEEAGVDDVLVIGGGLEHPRGNFYSSMNLLDTGLLDKYSITSIGIAGHPEGTPDFDEDAAYDALLLKQAFAERTDANMRIVTQFGFDAESFIDWAAHLAEHNVDLPVHLGVSGPAKLSTLVKFAVMCGVGPSVEFLKKRLTAVTNLLSGFDPETVVEPIEAYSQSNKFSVIKQIHVFPFGGAKKSAEWLYQRGSW